MEDEFKHLSRGDLIRLIIAMENEEGRQMPSGWWLGIALFAAILIPWVFFAMWIVG